ncbi:GntR family transcriptional regulator [Streptomyces sp. NPDC001508]|uniref:GntR family transcriptional regulator n=1 Tax=Streptomyces sp. NPDC001508 TaxID=3154656 RepID=UPI0033251B6E
MAQGLSSPAPLRHALDLNLSYTALIQAAGYTPSIEVLAHRVETVSPTDAKKLRLNADDEVIVIERIRYADKQPVVYSIDRIPMHVVPEELRGVSSPSIFDILDQSHHSPRAGRARLQPVLAEEPVTGYLDVAVGSPLLHFDQVDQDQSGTPVLTSYEWHTSDVFEMWINRTRGAQ